MQTALVRSAWTCWKDDMKENDATPKRKSKEMENILYPELRSIRQKKALQSQVVVVYQTLEQWEEEWKAEKEYISRLLDKSNTSRNHFQHEYNKLHKQIARFRAQMQHALEKNMRSLTHLRIMQKGAYAECFWKLAHALVFAGCARNKVGQLIQVIGRTFRITIDRIMDAWTVGQAIDEAGQAALIQAGYELAISRFFTHMNTLVPKYSKGETTIASSSKPAICYLGLATTTSHTAKASLDAWKHVFKSLQDSFNASPLAERIGTKLTLLHILKILCGICGNHASTEIQAGILLKEFKRAYILFSMGEESIQDLEMNQLFLLIHKKRTAWLELIGRPLVWNVMTHEQRVQLDHVVLEDIKMDLGEQQYQKLGPKEKQDVDLFLQCGCCMHKDMNAFKYGNDALVEFWGKKGLTGLLILANKQNAPLVRCYLTGKTGELTNDELAALQAST
uniref:Uncharacterized protein n=1 Tax=Moniliophthora roreri TaxID=221103 RepID=A0A0W0G9A1_MONRR